MESDDALSDEVESIFDPLKLGEVRITVRLPDSYGEPRVLSYSQLLFPDDIRIDPGVLPAEVERVARLLITSMRFR